MPALKSFVTMFSVLLVFWNFANVVAIKLPANEKVDKLLAKLRSHLQENGLDHFDLPTDSDTFNATLFNSTLEDLYGGGRKYRRDEHYPPHWRYGDRSETTKGFCLHPRSRWIHGSQGTLRELLPSGALQEQVRDLDQITSLSAELKLETGIAPPYSIRVLDCSIDELRTLHVKLRGLGLLDSRFYSILSNAITQILQPILQDALQDIACGLLQNKFPDTY